MIKPDEARPTLIGGILNLTNAILWGTGRGPDFYVNFKLAVLTYSIQPTTVFYFFKLQFSTS
jgi:hypothetical protein